MVTFTPEVELQTLFNLSANRRIISTREPNPSRGPLFALVRNQSQCAWALGSQVEHAVADELNVLVSEERPISNLRDPPKHAERYVSLLAGEISSGPAFTFPGNLTSPSNFMNVDNVERGFPVLTTDDDAPHRIFLISAKVT